MGRAPSAVWNEVCRNRVKRRYAPKKAHHKAYVRRKYAKYQGMKIVHHAALREEVEWRLFDDQSPEAVAGWIRRKKHMPSVSKDSIYRYIKSIHGRRIETHRYLKKHTRRRKRPKGARLSGRTFIDKRPLYINTRRRPGDAEFDFIVSGKSGKGILLVVVDRKLRASFLEKICPVSIPAVERAAARIKTRYPEWNTGTTDNDVLLQHHQRLEEKTGIRIFFCRPYHAWEKGTVEHMNGVIRRDIPKGADISRYSRYGVQRLEEKLNRRPMKCLAYRTPQEMLELHRKRTGKNKKHRRKRHSI